MLRLFLVLSLMVFALPARAGWELVTRNPRGDLYYLHSATAQKGEVSRVWSLVDLVSPIENSASVKRLYEADCVKGKLRVVQKIVYARKGGQGAALSTDKKPGPWTYPDPDSVNEALLLKICFDQNEVRSEAKQQKHEAANH